MRDFIFLILCLMFVVIGCIVFPLIPKRENKIYIPVGVHEITAYRAVKAECGNDRGYAKSGRRIAINGQPLGKFCANNFLPAGTKVVIPDISGDTVWTIEDKLKDYVNGVYIGNRFDLLISKGAAGIGLQRAEVFIVKEVK